ncbi:MAG: Flp pilus assembly complex ATPase component TadA [Armatimonadetes bacterium]|nr:Flp pilus assembly complex ATPase component TadA [Armatimonadota bacterium]
MDILPQTSLGEILASRGYITPEQLQQGLVEQKRTGKRIGETLVSLGYLRESEMLSCLAERMGLPLVNLADRVVDPAVLGRVPSEFALSHHVLPLASSDHTLTVAIADPLDLDALDDLQLLTDGAVEPVLASPSEIRRAIEQFYMTKMMQDISEQDVEILSEEGYEIADLQRMAREELVIQLVNITLQQAIQDRATDIHIEPFEKELRIRYRIDGVLQEVSSPPKRLHPAIVSRIKILSDMNIAERRLPQDGRMRLRSGGRQIDLRVSTIPTLFGESVVMRLLDRATALLGLEDLGMRAESLDRFRRLIRMPHGIILVTGPTGSGKTTSLNAALIEIYSPEKKIITIEDPVEYQLNGVNQIQVRPNIGLSFASGLRHIVRQDPDIIMVGEIRDSETVDIAIHAALTGHLVFSTLHTNDAAGAISRLLDMGAEPYLVASSLIGVVAQRLVRLNCPRCSAPVQEPFEALQEAGISPLEAEGARLMAGQKCEECKYTGYRGRSGLFEMLVIDDALRQMVMARKPSLEIRQYGIQQGMSTLLMEGRERILTGKTTLQEVLRVCQREEFDV